MTLYWTPINSYARRHMVERMMQHADWENEPASEVIFPVDVKAEGDNYVISALLPGVLADDLDIQVINETVTIRGELKVERNEKDVYLLRERPSGKFSRVLHLPTPLDPSGAEAHMDNGILTLQVSKAETARPKTIKVKAVSN